MTNKTMKNFFLEKVIYDHEGATTLIIVILIIALLFGGIYALTKISCEKRIKLMNLNGKYDFWTGCMVQIDNQWQPFNDYNTINLNNF